LFFKSLYETILKLQNDYRQRELDYIQQMDQVVKQRDDLQNQWAILRDEFESIQQEDKALKDEVAAFVCLNVSNYFVFCFDKMKSKDEINRDLKLALTTSNNDAQAVYNQLRQLNVNLTDLQEKYDRDLAERDQRIEFLQNEQKKLNVNLFSNTEKENCIVFKILFSGEI